MTRPARPAPTPEDVLGLDIGGVIIARGGDDEDTSFFGANFLASPTCAGAFASISELVRDRFGARVHLVSKCGPEVERKTRAWLEHRDFYETGVPRAQVHFCRERRDKAVIAKRLGITHFVDDRLEVLSYLATVPHRYLFDPIAGDLSRFAAHRPSVVEVASWAELVPLLAARP